MYRIFLTCGLMWEDCLCQFQMERGSQVLLEVCQISHARILFS